MNRVDSRWCCLPDDHLHNKIQRQDKSFLKSLLLQRMLNFCFRCLFQFCVHHLFFSFIFLLSRCFLNKDKIVKTRQYYTEPYIVFVKTWLRFKDNFNQQNAILLHSLSLCFFFKLIMIPDVTDDDSSSSRLRFVRNTLLSLMALFL